MTVLTPRRAAWVAAIAACLVYVTALGNDWALDDHGLIERNPAAHSIAAGFRAVLSPYWPPQGDFSAGLYRPFTTLSYALDWAVSGGRPLWFHLSNVVLHGLVTAMVVLVLLPWLPPAGALAAGLVFAVHPVHVEAVANVVGRAEVLAALGVLGAVLAARRYRRAERAGQRRMWLLAILMAVALALGSKEHGVVALFVLALDQALDGPDRRRRGWGLYVPVAVLTAGWLVLWRAVAGGLVGAVEAEPLRGIPASARLATAIPVLLEALRLLAWPADLAADYGPQTIPIRTEWTGVAALALVTASSLLAIAVAVRRAAPAVTFATLVGAATYLPTSNLLFTSGVMLAERALYLAVLAPAAAAGWVLARAWETRHRWHAAGAVGLVCVSFGWSSVARIPFWHDSRTVVLRGFVEHPESYWSHMRLAGVLLQTGDSSRALAHYLVAAELFDRNPVPLVRAGQLALAFGRPAQSLELARKAYAAAPGNQGSSELLVEAFRVVGEPDSALAAARDAVARNAQSEWAAALYGRAASAKNAVPR